MTNKEAKEYLITHCYPDYPDKGKVQWDRVMHKAITVLSESDWNPCSEPPKNEGPYLVYAPDYRGGSSGAKENYNGVMFSKYKNGKWSIEHGYHERPDCVKAWRPLPEPYGGDQE